MFKLMPENTGVAVLVVAITVNSEFVAIGTPPGVVDRYAFMVVAMLVPYCAMRFAEMVMLTAGVERVKPCPATA